MFDPTTRTDSAFWRFSLAFYAGAGIPQACLQLQDDYGADVNVLLYALFLARAGRQLGPEDVARLEASCADWRGHVVHPLRRARRFTKTPPATYDVADTATLRVELGRLELTAEYLQQRALEHTFPVEAFGAPNPCVDECARHNLAACAEGRDPFPPGPCDVLLRRVHDM